MTRQKTQRPRESASGASRRQTDAPVDRWRAWLLGAAAAVLTARLLVPIESKALPDGEGMPLVMLWCLTALATAALAWHRRWRLPCGPTDLALGALLVWHTASGLWAMRTAAPRPALSLLWEWLGLGLAYYVLRQVAPQGREARALVAGMLAVAAALSVLGSYQFFVTIPADRARYEANPDAALAKAGLDYAPGSPERARFEERLANAQPSATFTLTNSLAGYLAPWLVAALGIALWTWRQGRFRGRLAWGLAIVVLSAAGCLLLTESRSALLATAAGVIAVSLAVGMGQRMAPGKLLLGAGAAVAMLVVAAVAASGLGIDLVTGAKRSLGYRFEYWQSTWEMVRDHPWLGCGPGNFQMRYTQYKLPQALEEVLDPHNFLMEVWGTAGTPAVVALLAALVMWNWQVLRGPWHGDPTQAADRAQNARPQSARGSRPPQSAPGDGPGAERHIAAGVAAGVLLGWSLAWLATVQPNEEHVLLGLPVTVGVLWLLWPWVQGGIWPRGLGMVAVGVLLVNLLAAGGIGVPAVAQTLWLLLALGLNELPGRAWRTQPQPLARGAESRWHSAVRLTAVASAVVAAIACYATAYGPVLRAQGEVQRAKDDREQAEAHLLAAAQLDPWSEEPRLLLADWRFTQWRDTRGDEAWRGFEEALANGLRRAPHASGAWLNAGDQLLEAYQQARDPRLGVRAVEHYRRAVDLYPNDALRRARLALALQSVGQTAEAVSQADRARQLSQATPHKEKQLPSELLDRLPRKEGPKPGRQRDAAPTTDAGTGKAQNSRLRGGD